MTRRVGLACSAFAVALSLATSTHAQHRPMDVPDPAHTDVQTGRTRLILKDGTYQLVISYKVIGKVVRYRSAERGGEEEEIPVALVDLPATEQWKRAHAPGVTPQQQQQPVLSPELAKEEAARAALTPEIAPDLHLPEEDSVVALDTFRGTTELVPLPQFGSDLNKETAHAIQKGAINPASSAHRILDVPRERADIQLHVAEPIFYVRVNNPADSEADEGGAFTVNTHGATGRDNLPYADPKNDYVIERLDVRRDLRVLDSLQITWLGTGRTQPDIIEMRSELLPGGRWIKLTSLQPLDFGEYALVEILSADAVNLDVWDFGVHPDAPENVEALHPEPKRRPSLEHHPQP